jgi:hypothetical protein
MINLRDIFAWIFDKLYEIFCIWFFPLEGLKKTRIDVSLQYEDEKKSIQYLSGWFECQSDTSVFTNCKLMSRSEYNLSRSTTMKRRKWFLPTKDNGFYSFYCCCKSLGNVFFDFNEFVLRMKEFFSANVSKA